MDTHNVDQADIGMTKTSESRTRDVTLTDEGADSGAEYVITRNGRPVSRLAPCRKKPNSLFGIDRGRLEILGDINEPPVVTWEAETGEIPEENHCSSLR